MIDKWFPTLVYYSDLSQNNKLLVNRINEISNIVECKHDWNCNTYSTMGSYELSKDDIFTDLINDCANHVAIFAKEYGCIGDIHLKESWFNISRPGNYQEYHIHPSSHFSLVYYVKAPENSGNIIFKSHETNHDMFMLPVKEHVFCNYKTVRYPPKESRVLIFRSNLQHMVELNKTNEDRISISMNFIVR